MFAIYNGTAIKEKLRMKKLDLCVRRVIVVGLDPGEERLYSNRPGPFVVSETGGTGDRVVQICKCYRPVSACKTEVQG
jgi:hypothetical protein